MTTPAAPARRFSFLPPEPPRQVRFEDRAGGREVAVSGVIEMGELGPYGESLFYWRLWLPGCPQFGRASSQKAARDHLLCRIEQWTEAADLKSVGA